MPALAREKFALATRVCAIASDIIVLVDTWYTLRGSKAIACSVSVKVPISTLLLQDGIIYFGALLVLNVVDMVLWSINVFYDITTFFIAVLDFRQSCSAALCSTSVFCVDAERMLDRSFLSYQISHLHLT
ncbi:hypothetical protein AcV7_003723 [Taiwanofungus camphoratus]|nr:hypothetical protein AcV7_003723 [Antrodia cinnamomea]